MYFKRINRIGHENFNFHIVIDSLISLFTGELKTMLFLITGG